MISPLEYPLITAVDAPRTEYYALREGRDVIRLGILKMWDAPPGHGCPVQDRFYRGIGVRVFTAVNLNLQG